MDTKKICEYLTALEKTRDLYVKVMKENRNLIYENSRLEERLKKYEPDDDDDSVNGDINDSDYESDDESVTSSMTHHKCGNCQLADHFYFLSAKQDNDHKKDTYKYVGDLIKNLNFDVTCGEDIAHFRGVGKKSVRIVDDFLSDK